MSYIQWPAIILYAGDDELTLVRSQQGWDSDDGFMQTVYAPDDMLIDSTGNAFRISSVNGGVVLEPIAESKTLNEINRIIRRHFAQSGNCCVSKFHANSIVEALQSVDSSE